MRSKLSSSSFFLVFAWMTVFLAPPCFSDGPNLPAPPQTFLDTTFVPPTGASIPVNAGDDLQKALDRANPGDEIVLQAGASFVGSFKLRNKPSGSGWITIRTSQMNGIPPDRKRVNPSYASAMPKIITNNSNAALSTEPGAHNYRIVGVEMAVAPGVNLNYSVVFLGDGNTLDQLPSNIIFDRVYIHGAVLCHCKQGIILNSQSTAVINSYLSEFHAIDQDTQALLGYNGPGPFKIVNNYLEASGENIMFGGVTAQITGLVPSDIEFRNNYLAKPLRWRTSIIPKPQGLSISAADNGGLASGATYYYVVVATGPGDYVPALQSDPSGEVNVTLSGTQGSVQLSWNPVSYGDQTDSRAATAYRVYRTTDPPSVGSKRSWTYYTVAAGAGQSFTDSGEPGTAGNPPVGGNRWVVKNLFELKNAQRVLLDGNVMEYCWQQAQDGVAILLSARIQPPTQLWSVVQDVTVSHNLIRHAATGAAVLGMDTQCGTSQLTCVQSARILFQNNLFDDISAANWGGHGWFLQVQHSADVTVDHNTAFSDRQAMYLHEMNVNLTVTNNIIGGDIGGDGAGGTSALAQYTTNAVVTNNALVRGLARYYGGTPGNFFPKTWSDVGFTNYAFHQYGLNQGSSYQNAGTDGQDLGADLNAVSASTATSVTGNVPGQPPAIASLSNAASFAADAVAPGSIISLFGANFSGATLSAALDPLPDTLGDTVVTMNGLPVPLLFINDGQVNAQVPFELNPGSATATVITGGVSSTPFTFQVASAAPGLYLSGSGHALALNQDSTVNTATNPAPGGTVMTAFLTGQGLVSPALATGSPSPPQPLYQPALPVSATVGGQQVQILYAGLTPGTVGVFQIDFVAPSLPAGDYPVVVTIGDVSSNSALVSIST